MVFDGSNVLVVAVREATLSKELLAAGFLDDPAYYDFFAKPFQQGSDNISFKHEVLVLVGCGYENTNYSTLVVPVCWNDKASDDDGFMIRFIRGSHGALP